VGCQPAARGHAGRPVTVEAVWPGLARPTQIGLTDTKAVT
jgi:hypothetical protein